MLPLFGFLVNTILPYSTQGFYLCLLLLLFCCGGLSANGSTELIFQMMVAKNLIGYCRGWGICHAAGVNNAMFDSLVPAHADVRMFLKLVTVLLMLLVWIHCVVHETYDADGVFPAGSGLMTLECPSYAAHLEEA
ncbi:hypothetical protein Nepgr_013461 [Nepenthes gracilis]|uniref:Uncharacterized protein n=1 Tax=Nepenthes gracilis TaxID=150966 RepID=A0AAD3SIW2_NEPGR|nr:hypothetical protein Nepgr_013461 [Nepenthes gracilis]